MRIHCLCVPVTAAITLSIVPSLAGPCSPEIDRMQSGVDTLVAATAVAGPAGRQSTTAMTHPQPTLGSIAAAEAKVKGSARAERAKAAMERARAADRAGDASTCAGALAELQREIGQ